MKKGYWVAKANVINGDKQGAYGELAEEVIAKFNGKFLVRGGKQTEFENNGYERTVIVEFETYKDAIDCYNSKNYQDALKHVHCSANRLVSVVEGV